MIKKTIDFKLINIALIVIIGYFIYQVRNLWFFIIAKIISIISPILISFVIAYFLYPLLKRIEKYLNKKISIFLLILIVFIIFILIFNKVLPILLNQIINIFGDLIYFAKELSIKTNFDIIDKVLNIFNYFIENIASFSVKIYRISINLITNIIIIFFLSIYFLYDMDKIRIKIKNYLIKKNKLYDYIYLLDKEFNNYIKGLIFIMIISFFEYTIVYFLIGHPDFLLLGLISSLSNLIPSVGAFIVLFIAFITSFLISKKLGIIVLIVSLILSIIDSYFINPFVYKKSNQINPILLIISISICSSLFGFIGVLISIPLSILVITTYKFIKKTKFF